jgi:hypothetical protein
LERATALEIILTTNGLDSVSGDPKHLSNGDEKDGKEIKTWH